MSKINYANPFNPETELKAYRDWKNTIDTAVSEAVGKAKTEHILKIAKNMRKENLDIELIAKLTGLSREDVENL